MTSPAAYYNNYAHLGLLHGWLDTACPHPSKVSNHQVGIVTYQYRSWVSETPHVDFLVVSTSYQQSLRFAAEVHTVNSLLVSYQLPCVERCARVLEA